MRAVSAALVLLAGVGLLAVGYLSQPGADGLWTVVGIQGALIGGGESAQITIEKDGYWYLKGQSLTDQPLNLGAVSVRINRK